MKFLQFTDSGVSYKLKKYVHEVLVNHLVKNLPRKKFG